MQPAGATAPQRQLRCLLEQSSILAWTPPLPGPRKPRWRRHPNLVSFLGLCTLPPCLLTEYCAEGSLYDVLRQGAMSPAAAARLTWARRVGIALDAARGLAYLHLSSPPIIHRDVRPDALGAGLGTWVRDEWWRVGRESCSSINMPAPHVPPRVQVKSPNILLDGGRAKIADFNLSQLLKSKADAADDEGDAGALNPMCGRGKEGA